MSCNNCNDYNSSGCGCTSHTYIDNSCGCPEPAECSCRVYISSDCVNQVKSEFPCLGIESGLPLTQTLEAMDAAICEKIESQQSNVQLINVGSGAKVYKGNNLLGQKEIRKLNTVGSILTITENTDDITFSLDEDAFKVYGVANTENIGGFYKDTTVTPSETTFNFKVLKHSPQTGNGAEIIRDIQVNTDDLTIRSKKIKSSNSSIMITSTDEEIDIEIPSFEDIPRFIVNSAYTGVVELGTYSQPFKTIELARAEYIGYTTGTAQNPENINGEIIIQKGIGYTYTGNFSFNTGLGSIILEEGCNVISNPSVGEYLCDFDTLSPTTSARLNIVIKDNAALQLNKNGFRNGGTSINNGAFSDVKSINITGGGTIYQVTNDNINILYSILESNFTTSNNLKNDSGAAFNIKGVTLFTNTQQIYKIGGNSEFIIYNTAFQSQATNPNIKIFEQIGGRVRVLKSDYNLLLASINVLFSIEKNGTDLCNLIIVDSIMSVNAVTLIQNEASKEAVVEFKNVKNVYGSIVNIAKSPNILWQKINLNNCIFTVGTIDDTQIDLTNNNTTSTSNIIGNKVLESLQVFSSRADAVSSGALKKGNAFINRKVITAGSFVVGTEYKVKISGSPSVGAIDSYFIAIDNGNTYTGAEVYSYVRDILI